MVPINLALNGEKNTSHSNSFNEKFKGKKYPQKWPYLAKWVDFKKMIEMILGVLGPSPIHQNVKKCVCDLMDF